MNLLRSSRGRVIAGVLLLLALFLVRPGAQRLRARIVRSISLGLGRPVDVGAVTLRLLPQPGFELENFVIREDPEFGAEPVLQSSDVVAILRVSSMLRGRLEIARLSFTEPSINLVRNSGGRWNLERLIERAAGTSVAPTSKTSGEVRPSFPYIEADHSRINFKFGQEKKPYSLNEATFALWQESENAWGVRLKAQPVRTDFNLSDTGVLEVEGSWERSANLHETPLQFTLQWDGAQLGQATKLTSGQDKGWRGAVRLAAQFTGRPADLTIHTETSIEDFRRYDISSERSLRLAAQCNAHYSSANHLLSGLECRAPIADGSVALTGSFSLQTMDRAYDLTLLAQKVPLQPLVDLAQRVKKNLPADLVATGSMGAKVTLHHPGAGSGSLPIWQGGGVVTALNARSVLSSTRLAVDKIPFIVTSSGSPGANENAAPGRRSAISSTNQPRLEIGPFNLALGRPANASLHGLFTRSGYHIELQGDAEVQRLLEVARFIGLPAPQPAANGGARVNLLINGDWAGFAAAGVTGSAQLRSVRARLRGLNEPVEVSSASVEFAVNKAEVRKLTASVAGTTLRGSLTIPRQCESAASCLIRFDLKTDEFAANKLGGLVNPVPGKQPWYRFLSSPAQSRPFLATVHAAGRVTASRVLLHHLVANRVSAEMELERGHLHLSDLQADVLGGRHTGDWLVDFTVNPPAYRGKGTLEQIALDQLSEAMQDHWITGTASVDYRAEAAGWTRAELISDADGTFQIEAHDGSLPHLTLAGESEPLRVNELAGRLLLHDGSIGIEQGKLQTPANIYQVSGKASLSRVLDIRLARDGARGFNITGTLSQPRVAIGTLTETQAALKP